MWRFWAYIYQHIRKPWPLSWILEQERRNIFSLTGQIPSMSGKFVLDVGCGKGEAAKYGAEGTLWGVDRSIEMLNSGASPYLVRVVGDARALPFLSGFELILAVGISEYLLLDNFLLECRRVLKPGGVILLTSSPPGMYTRLRLLLGLEIYPRKSETIINSALEKGFVLLDKVHSFSQDAFLLQRIG